MKALMILAACSLSLTMAVTALQPTAPVQRQTISGNVLDAQSRRPVAGASVSLDRQQVFTDSLGYFSIPFTGGNALLKIAAEGYVTQQIRAYAGKPVTVLLVNDLDLSENTVIEEISPSKVRTEALYERMYTNPAVGMMHQSASHWYQDTEPVHSTDEFNAVAENIFHSPLQQPLSTFSINANGASYSLVRRMVSSGSKPVAGAVRAEELINYFSYDFPEPTNGHPISALTEYGPAPWAPGHTLVMVGLKAQAKTNRKVTGSNLVFLIDVSGSMDTPDRLPLVKTSLRMLAEQLSPADRVAMVVYAGRAGLVLPSTPASEKAAILKAIDQLSAGGSTAGGQGIQLAYKVAAENLIEGGNNRIVLCTDGDFNVGVSSTAELVKMVENERKNGIYLTIAGFGMGNYKDHRMDELSKAGNGNYYYIDKIREAEKVFVHDLRSTLNTVADDVKIQVEFNPATVAGYRLIGYEKRKLASEDFNNDAKDAGEMGANTEIVALYEVIPAGVKSEHLQAVDPLKYQTSQPANNREALLTLKVRYKVPGQAESKLLSQELKAKPSELAKTSANFRWAAAVAAYSMLLTDSPYKGTGNLDLVLGLGEPAKGEDPFGYRHEFLQMVRSTKFL